MIEFENVTKLYPNGVKANDNISFQVKEGETLGIVGANGAGKSTLFRQLFGIISTTEGRILIDGKEGVRDDMSYVPQFPVIYPYLTVLESVELGLRYQCVEKKEARRRSQEVLECLEMQDMAGQYSYALSGGQQKKLSFATALAQDRKYMILDEVTSMVDIVSKQKIWEVLQKIQKKKGIIISSHDLAEVKNLCDKILILKNGKVTYYGETANVSDKVYKIMVQAEGMEELVSYLQIQSIDFEVKTPMIQIYVKEFDMMMRICHEINEKFEIRYLNFEYPAFFEGVLQYV